MLSVFKILYVHFNTIKKTFFNLKNHSTILVPNFLYLRTLFKDYIYTHTHLDR